MLRRFTISMLLLGGVVASSESNAQTALSGSDWCEWSGTACTTGGTLSSDPFMIAHRPERHSMVTYDGAIHVIVNTGLPGPSIFPSTDALQLWTLAPGATTWTFQPLLYDSVDIFANTTGGSSTNYTSVASTTDVAVMPQAAEQSTMTLVFTDNNNSTVEEAQLLWNGSYWSVTQFSYPTPVLTAPSDSVYMQPSYVSENQGSGATFEGEYLAVVELGTGDSPPPSVIQVFYNGNATSPTYVNTGLSIPGNSDSNIHAPRLVWLPGIDGLQTVGLLYQAGKTATDQWLCWEVILNEGDSEWRLSHPSTPVYVGQMPNSQNIFYNTGFSVATVVTAYSTDEPGTQYLAYLADTRGGGPFVQTEVYTPGISASWGSPQPLTTAGAEYPPSYVKVTYTTSYTTMEGDEPITVPPYANVFFDNYTVPGDVLYVDAESAQTPFGSCTTCYLPAYTLNPVPYEGSFLNPRLEAPEYVFPTENEGKRLPNTPS
jgi:hypothetical protein